MGVIRQISMVYIIILTNKTPQMVLREVHFDERRETKGVVGELTVLGCVGGSTSS